MVKRGPGSLPFLLGLLALWLSVLNGTGAEGAAAPAASTNEVVILATNGVVEVLRAGATTWDFASPIPDKNILHPGDQLRTATNSFATVQLADRSIKQIGPSGLIQVLAQPARRAGVNLRRGLFFFLHRDDPGDVQVLTPTVAAVIRGTEFSVEVLEDGGTTLHLLDGAVDMTNAFGRLELGSGDSARALPGAAPVPLPKVEAATAIQWCLYYPAVLAVPELGLPVSAREALAESLAAYETGDLRAALARYPAGREPADDEEKVYVAALLLAVGNVVEANGQLASLQGHPGSRPQQLAEALRRLMAAVKLQPVSEPPDPSLATSLMAESYYQQSRAQLDAALAAARGAAALAPDFGFAHARVAELEFAFGRRGPARLALERSLQQSPRHAPAFVLRGYVQAADGRLRQAIADFDQAIALEAGMGNAWLGRGLCRIRRGDSEGGRRDLEVAAAAEPQRALLRSYLGKAFQNEGNARLAEHELALARKLDPQDPTSWLYSALLHQSANRINEAIRELETSLARNQQRAVYRSRFLLDEDRAVRGANLAAIYEDGGLKDPAQREAARAAEEEYANYSAHLFLANSYNQLRDPNQVDLRYETPWLSEFLIANLLAPVGAGTLSQTVSDQEYSRLLEQDRLGLASHTEYRSHGDWFQAGAQYGTFGDFGYAAEALYRFRRGDRPNNDQEQLTLSFQFKQRITAQDGLYFQAIYYTAESGDLARYYSQAEANPGLRLAERQEPILLAGYHHEWAPGVHTLVLGARLHDRLSVTNPTQRVFIESLTNGVLRNLDVLRTPLDYHSELEIYSVEGQQIWERDPVRLIVGARYQHGDFDTRDQLAGFFFIPNTATNVSAGFERIDTYAHLHWHPLESLRLIGGLSYERVSYPSDFRDPPVSEHETERAQVSPVAGLVWTPGASTTIRGAYAQSLGGASIDQSFQLEPSQIAGFLQSFRSLVPESAVGPASVPRFEIAGLALDQKFSRGTYLGISGDWRRSDATRHAGSFEADERDIGPGLTQIFVSPSSLREKLEYDERTLTVALNQLLGDDWAVGAEYRLSDASLLDSFPDVPKGTPAFGGFVRQDRVAATLHQVWMHAVYHHPCGFYAGADSVWSAQSNRGYTPDIPGDDFWQFNLHAGYRFFRRRMDARVSLLNLTDQDYRLNPLNLTAELPRERMLALSLRLSF